MRENENIIREKILKIVENVLTELDNNIEIGADDVINVPFTVDGNHISQSSALDSLEIVTIIVEIENEFDIEIADDDMFNFSTVNDLVRIVRNNINTLENKDEDEINA